MIDSESKKNLMKMRLFYVAGGILRLRRFIFMKALKVIERSYFLSR